MPRILHPVSPSSSPPIMNVDANTFKSIQDKVRTVASVLRFPRVGTENSFTTEFVFQYNSMYGEGRAYCQMGIGGRRVGDVVLERTRNCRGVLLEAKRLRYFYTSLSETLRSRRPTRYNSVIILVYLEYQNFEIENVKQFCAERIIEEKWCRAILGLPTFNCSAVFVEMKLLTAC